MDADNGIEKEAIKTQLPVFKGGSAEKFLHFLNEFSNTKAKLGYMKYQKLENRIEQLQCFNDEKLTRIFYFAMPNRWRTNFINSGQSLHTTMLEALKTYMVHQEQQTDAHRCKNKENNNRNGQGRNFNKRSRQNYNSPSTNKSSHTQGQGKKKKKRLDNNDNCPIHGPVHKWGQCHQNQYGENFKPRRQSNHSSSNSHFTSQASRSSAYHRGNGMVPPPTQVYFHQQ